MRAVLGGYIDRGQMPGLVTLVSLGDDCMSRLGALVHRRAMKRDTIFRIASMTKPTPPRPR